MTQAYLFAGANFALCMFVVFISLCRLNLMNNRVIQRTRTEYAFYIGAGVASALQPWWGEWPEWGSILMASAMVYGLLASGIGWRHGPPEAVTAPAPLEN